MSLLFEPPARFRGLPEAAFPSFGIADRDARRTAIVDGFHVALRELGQDLCESLTPADGTAPAFHLHLPRLDWPRGYQPFCTWLALSRESHGYQAGPQLNVGVHRDHVAARLGWDTASDAFGRFEFLCRRGSLEPMLLETAGEASLCFRVYAAAEWPEGSRLVFESADDVGGSFREVKRRGVWWELGTRWEWPAEREVICTARLGAETLRVFRALLPIYDRVTGDAA